MMSEHRKSVTMNNAENVKEVTPGAGIEFGEPEYILVLPGGNWDDHETMYRNRGIPTRHQLNIISAKARDGVNNETCMKYIMRQTDSDVQYKLLMQYMNVKQVDRPTVRAWVKVSKPDIKSWEQLKKDGLSVEQIAERAGRARGTVWHALARESGLSIYSPDENRIKDLRANNKPMNNQDIQKVRELYHHGMSITRIGKLMNRHHSTISKYV